MPRAMGRTQPDLLSDAPAGGDTWVCVVSGETDDP